MFPEVRKWSRPYRRPHPDGAQAAAATILHVATAIRVRTNRDKNSWEPKTPGTESAEEGALSEIRRPSPGRGSCEYILDALNDYGRRVGDIPALLWLTLRRAPFSRLSSAII